MHHQSHQTFKLISEIQNRVIKSGNLKIWPCTCFRTLTKKEAKLMILIEKRKSFISIQVRKLTKRFPYAFMCLKQKFYYHKFDRAEISPLSIATNFGPTLQWWTYLYHQTARFQQKFCYILKIFLTQMIYHLFLHLMWFLCSRSKCFAENYLFDIICPPVYSCFSTKSQAFRFFSLSLYF